MFKIKNPFSRNPVVIVKPTRYDKRHYVVGEKETLIIDYIWKLAINLNRLFPYKSAREYYQPIYKAHMKNGPAEAKKVAKRLLLQARIDKISSWYGKAFYYLYFHIKYFIKPVKTPPNPPKNS